jgi:hypothetical protein
MQCYTYAKLSVNSSRQIVLDVMGKLEGRVEAGDLRVKVDGVESSLRIVTQGADQVVVEVTGLPKTSAALEFEIVAALRDTDGFEFAPKQFALAIPKSSGKTPRREEEEAKGISQSITGLGTVFVIAGSVLSSDPTMFDSVIFTTQLIAYLPLADFEFTPSLRGLLIGANVVENMPRFFDLDCSAPSKLASKYGFKCSNFLITAQKELTLLVGFLTLVVGVSILRNKWTAQKEALGKIYNLLAFKGLKKAVGALAADLTVKAAIQITSLPDSSVASWASFAVAVIVVSGYGALALLSFRRFIRHTPGGPAFEELTDTRASVLYYFILYSQRIVFGLVLSLLSSPFEVIAVLLSTLSLVSSP